ncbi:MAG: MerR family transcriptional regulator [Chloroflexota bacterium]
MQAEGFRPAEAAASLGVPASTLRLYSVRFGAVLSEAAARPVERAGGKPGFRLYTEQDLAVLREGKALLERGLTYDDALAELRRHWRPRVVRRLESVPRSQPEVDTPGEPSAPTAAPAVVPMPAVDTSREAAWSGLVAHLMASLTASQALADEWRRLVEDRNVEIASLRERVEELETRRRVSWWRRLFG